MTAVFEDEVVTAAKVRYLRVPGVAGELALVTLDNGHDHTRPSTFGPGVTLFWASAFSTITPTAASMPIRFGSSCVPPQPGTRPRKTSGKATTAVEAMVR